MSKLDDLTTQALSKEDQELLARHAEPGYFAQAFGLFRGSLSWVMWLVYVVVLITAALSLYAFWQLYVSSDALAAVKWATAGLALSHIVFMGKNFMGSHMEANRMLREIKRVELQVSLLRAARP
jgi:hypothetical protein